ncbi:MAG: diguanylate cyclase [Proteobacteria bacterium]|nr:MAG: diguanylate cyclase [Pseudomonadota bacterium]
MKDMKYTDVQPGCTETELTFQDGSRRRVFYNEQEVPYPEGKLIVSRTDLTGIITHCNNSFVDMSAYSHEELIGQAHHILRHPDMPSLAFAEMWSTIQAGQKWSGYVKNLRKDGAYYWVYATIIPNIRQGVITGYTSVRRKPSRSKVNECVALYKRLRLEEGKA